MELNTELSIEEGTGIVIRCANAYSLFTTFKYIQKLTLKVHPGGILQLGQCCLPRHHDRFQNEANPGIADMQIFTTLFGVVA